MQMQIMFFINEFDMYFRIISILNSHISSTHAKSIARVEQSLRLVESCQEAGIRGSPTSEQRWEKANYKILHQLWCKRMTQVSSGASGMFSTCLFFLYTFGIASSYTGQ